MKSIFDASQCVMLMILLSMSACSNQTGQPPPQKFGSPRALEIQLDDFGTLDVVDDRGDKQVLARVCRARSFIASDRLSPDFHWAAIEVGTTDVMPGHDIGHDERFLVYIPDPTIFRGSDYPVALGIPALSANQLDLNVHFSGSRRSWKYVYATDTRHGRMIIARTLPKKPLRMTHYGCLPANDTSNIFLDTPNGNTRVQQQRTRNDVDSMVWNPNAPPADSSSAMTFFDSENLAMVRDAVKAYNAGHKAARLPFPTPQKPGHPSSVAYWDQSVVRGIVLPIAPTVFAIGTGGGRYWIFLRNELVGDQPIAGHIASVDADGTLHERSR